MDENDMNMGKKETPFGMTPEEWDRFNYSIDIMNAYIDPNLIPEKLDHVRDILKYYYEFSRNKKWSIEDRIRKLNNWKLHYEDVKQDLNRNKKHTDVFEVTQDSNPARNTRFHIKEVQLYIDKIAYYVNHLENNKRAQSQIKKTTRKKDREIASVKDKGLKDIIKKDLIKKFERIVGTEKILDPKTLTPDKDYDVQKILCGLIKCLYENKWTLEDFNGKSTQGCIIYRNTFNKGVSPQWYNQGKFPKPQIFKMTK